MSNRGQFRPTPLTTADALPGNRSASRHFEVGCGSECVALFATSDTSLGWVFSPDEARRLGFHLMAVADLIENREKEN